MQKIHSISEKSQPPVANDTLISVEKEIEEERLWREKQIQKKSEPITENGIAKTETKDLKPFSGGDSGAIQPEVLKTSSELLRQEGSRSMRLLNSSASALHSHMRRVLDTQEDVRPTLERTEQAVQCAQNIALLLRTQSEMMKAMRELERD